ncbi:MAG TPA: hypothetical protein VEY12_08875 [Thermoplasmata archaeon]|nr:hypothetical protein [Thermoplasmata archaeon]
MSRPRPALLAAAFLVLFAVIANLAWATAITTSGPWYDATVSADVYLLAGGIGALLAVVLVLEASRSAASLDASMRRVDRRIALLRVKARSNAGSNSAPSPNDPLDDLDGDLEVDGSGDSGSASLVRIEREGHDTLVPLPSAREVVRSGAAAEVLRQLVTERVALREARARMWSTTVGPVALCVVFLAIAGPMLPGSGPFAAAHYQLNTTLVLFLSYGLAPLVAWSVIGLGMLGALGRRPSQSQV